MAKAVKTASLHVRMDPEMKEQANQLFNDLGMTLSDAVTLFFTQALTERGLPFSVYSNGTYNHNQTIPQFNEYNK